MQASGFSCAAHFLVHIVFPSCVFLCISGFSCTYCFSTHTCSRVYRAYNAPCPPILTHIGFIPRFHVHIHFLVHFVLFFTHALVHIGLSRAHRFFIPPHTWPCADRSNLACSRTSRLSSRACSRAPSGLLFFSPRAFFSQLTVSWHVELCGHFPTAPPRWQSKRFNSPAWMRTFSQIIILIIIR